MPKAKCCVITARQSEWPRLYLLVLMALTTGARLGEMLNLRWSDVDLAKRRATLHKTKNGSKRVLTLPVAVIQLYRIFFGTIE